MTATTYPLGILFSTTGSYGTVGRTMLTGALLAASDLNADAGRLVRLEPFVIDPASSAAAYVPADTRTASSTS